MDPDPFDTDPDPALHFDTDTDRAAKCDVDPDPIVLYGSESLPFIEVMFLKQYFLYILA